MLEQQTFFTVYILKNWSANRSNMYSAQFEPMIHYLTQSLTILTAFSCIIYTKMFSEIVSPSLIAVSFLGNGMRLTFGAGNVLLAHIISANSRSDIQQNFFGKLETADILWTHFLSASGRQAAGGRHR